MSQKTDADLIIEADVIANETVAGANTKARVATMFKNIVDSKPNNSVITTLQGEVDATEIVANNAGSAASAAQTAANAAQSTANAAQPSSGKDASNGYAGLTLFKINFKNALDTFTSFFTNSNSAAHIYTFPDRTDTIATMQDIEVVSVVSVNAAAVLTDSAFGKIHELIDNGGVTDYTLTLPTPSAGNAQKTIYFKGLSSLTKVVTLSNGAITIDGYTSFKIGALGILGIKSNGTNYTVIAEVGSWIPWTAVEVGWSSLTAVTEYWKQGRRAELSIIISVGTSDSATTTLEFPFIARKTEQYILRVKAGATFQSGFGFTTAGTNLLTFQQNAAGSAFATSGDKLIIGTMSIAIQ